MLSSAKMGSFRPLFSLSPERGCSLCANVCFVREPHFMIDYGLLGRESIDSSRIRSDTRMYVCLVVERALGIPNWGCLPVPVRFSGADTKTRDRTTLYSELSEISA